MKHDLAIVGAGIVGLATAWAYTRNHPNRSLIVIEKEKKEAQHQTGNNSGVLHAGMYYKPGTLRATLCQSGKRMMEEFCTEHGVAWERCGKVIVAVDAPELPRLKSIYERGIANGVPGLRWIDASELRALEPHAAGIAAVHSPNTGIADYKAVSAKLRDLLSRRGVQFKFSSHFDAVTHLPGGSLALRASGETIDAKALITCGGLHADRLAQLMGAGRDVRIVPFRGEYFFLKPERQHLVKGLIYPVPDPAFPFLGVHFTKTTHGRVEAGPNAVFALAREGYGWRNISLRDLADALGFAGFQTLAKKFWRTGLMEMRRSLSQPLFVAALQRLVPELAPADVVRGGAGVRAQAIGRDGALLDDFAFVDMPNALHVLNAPSPAATASLAIGEYIVERAEQSFSS